MQYLENALSPENFEETKKPPNLSKFRNTFSEPLLDSMKAFIINKLENIEISLESAIDKPEEYIDELESLLKELEEENSHEEKENGENMR